MGLFTVTPSPEGGGTEVVGGGYVRTLITFTAAVNGTVSNAVDTQFPDSNDAWGLIGHFGIFDSVSGGNLLYYDLLATPRSIQAGEHFVFEAGKIVVVEF